MMVKAYDVFDSEERTGVTVYSEEEAKQEAITMWHKRGNGSVIIADHATGMGLWAYMGGQNFYWIED